MADDDEDVAVIGQAMLDLAARLPENTVDTGFGAMHSPSVDVYFDAVDQMWAVEFSALDPDRNFTLENSSLEVVMRQALDRDRKAAPNV